MVKNKFYILLEYYNDYDQHGGYFRGIYSSRELAEAEVDHTGRWDGEPNWFEVINWPYGVYFAEE